MPYDVYNSIFKWSCNMQNINEIGVAFILTSTTTAAVNEIQQIPLPTSTPILPPHQQ